MALWRIIREAAVRFPDRIAVSVGEQHITYTQLDDLVERVAAGLRFQGLGESDRVITFLGNTIEHLGLLLGCFRAGLVAVPLAPWSIPAQIRHAVRSSGARGIVAPTATLRAVFEGHEELRPEVMVTVGDLNPPPPVLPWEIIEAGPGQSPTEPDPRLDHLAMIVYTSGTTNRPKAVIHTQNRMARRALAFADDTGLTSEDVAFVAAGICRPMILLGQIMPMCRAGGRCVMIESPKPGLFWSAYKSRPPKTYVMTGTGTTDALFANPAARDADHSALRLWIAGGDIVPKGLHGRFRETTGRDLVEMSGMTETGFFAINPLSGPVRPGSCGRLMRGVEIRLLGPDGHEAPAGEAGEIAIRSNDLMFGYWNDTAETFRVLREGWLHTGDLARIDDDGFLWHLGRAQNIINRGGRRISPTIIEQALSHHPAITRAVVVPAPDTASGQVPFAFMTLRAGHDRPDEAGLKAWLADQLDTCSMPEGFAYIDEWPLTYHGKLDRARLTWIAANGGEPF
ncbi:class I adenylate-forming enzyme family protein [Zavarzinella formosa]|uniref:class I adenylate-forming enzyme family protein n=1 Tax=Zavarzinella formosa TaxID=360055 RepID=UPI0002F82207|nr:class I adenylate-forming enzyme family protein [Zavarzinella formosa]